RSGVATLTRKARSRWTVSSSRGVSRDTAAVVPPSPYFTTGGSADQGRSPLREPTGACAGSGRSREPRGAGGAPSRPARGAYKPLAAPAHAPEPTGRGLGAETGWSSPETASTPGRPARRAPGVQERTSIGDGSLYCFTPARFLDGLRLRGRCVGVLLARIRATAGQHTNQPAGTGQQQSPHDRDLR